MILVFFFIIPVCKHVLCSVMQSQIWCLISQVFSYFSMLLEAYFHVGLNSVLQCVLDNIPVSIAYAAGAASTVHLKCNVTQHTEVLQHFYHFWFVVHFMFLLFWLGDSGSMTYHHHFGTMTLLQSGFCKAANVKRQVLSNPVCSRRAFGLCRGSFLQSAMCFCVWCSSSGRQPSRSSLRTANTILSIVCWLPDYMLLLKRSIASKQPAPVLPTLKLLFGSALVSSGEIPSFLPPQLLSWSIFSTTEAFKTGVRLVSSSFSCDTGVAAGNERQVYHALLLQVCWGGIGSSNPSSCCKQN